MAYVCRDDRGFDPILLYRGIVDYWAAAAEGEEELMEMFRIINENATPEGRQLFRELGAFMEAESIGLGLGASR